MCASENILLKLSGNAAMENCKQLCVHKSQKSPEHGKHDTK